MKKLYCIYLIIVAVMNNAAWCMNGPSTSLEPISNPECLAQCTPEKPLPILPQKYDSCQGNILPEPIMVITSNEQSNYSLIPNLELPDELSALLTQQYCKIPGIHIIQLLENSVS